MDPDTLMAEAGRDDQTLKGFSASFEKWLEAQKKPKDNPGPGQGPESKPTGASASGSEAPKSSTPGIDSSIPGEKGTPQQGQEDPIEKVKKLKVDDPKTYDYVSRALGTDGMGSPSLALLFLKEVEALKNQGEDPGPADFPSAQGKIQWNKEKKKYGTVK